MSRRCPRSSRSTRSSTSSRLLLLHCRSEALVAVGVPLGSLLHGVGPSPALPWRPRLLHTLVQAVLALKGEGTDKAFILLSFFLEKRGHYYSFIFMTPPQPLALYVSLIGKLTMMVSMLIVTSCQLTLLGDCQTCLLVGNSEVGIFK